MPLSIPYNSLFKEGIIPQPLYRLTNNEHIHSQDGIFTDKEYLSCTSDFYSFINHFEGEQIACLQFDIPHSFKRIDVYSLFQIITMKVKLSFREGFNLVLSRYKHILLIAKFKISWIT